MNSTEIRSCAVPIPRLRNEDGFTLIELLVVILIIGVLAGVAIPSFLSQTNKASDSNVFSALHTAHVTQANYRVANGGYASSMSGLTALEPALGTQATNFSMTDSLYAASGTATATTGYQVVATNPKDSVSYTLKYDATTGAVTRICAPAGTGACSSAGTWGS